MSAFSIRSLDRNSRLSLANVRNRAEQNQLKTELDHLDNEKKTMLRMLRNDKLSFKSKYGKNDVLRNQSNIFDQGLSKYYIPSEVEKQDGVVELEVSKKSGIDFEQLHHMLFTHDEIDKDKIMCLHLISAHRTESLMPPKKKAAILCKIHCPLERLLERSKRKHIHLEQKMTSMLPIYTIEIESGRMNDPINDGRLANRLLLNERIREIINTVLSALHKSNPEKNREIFEMANDVAELKKLFTKKSILTFLDELSSSPIIYSCSSFILTAPFRVRSVQLELRTITGSVEHLVRRIRHDVLQLPPRPKLLDLEAETVGADGDDSNTRKVRHRKSFKMQNTTDQDTLKKVGLLYGDKLKLSAKIPEQERKLGRHTDVNFIQKNITDVANVKKIEYDIVDEEEEIPKPKKFTKVASRYQRGRNSASSSLTGNVLDRPYIQPVKFNERVTAIIEDIEKRQETAADNQNEEDTDLNKHDESNAHDDAHCRLRPERKLEDLRIHLKQTTCPACMEKYKIPLPTPKTPRVKPSSVLPGKPGENPYLKTNSRIRLSMLIDQEMFKMQSYEKRFSSEVTPRKYSLRKREMESCSSEQLNLSPLELAKIEQEIREKEIQKKLEKFLSQ
ncbi:hypothetical protein GWI33_005132 [Rhynchophorus ferrugineus]|uniref:Uncharacterized protein n=2 Tax=Rhynchophorus ferrugineus TaxID=354439 RepID=A0A834IYK0_RHYFE|nr:hypothetical protein GWI33_005132 [Rhynchophorus ferrugineus]